MQIILYFRSVLPFKGNLIWGQFSPASGSDRGLEFCIFPPCVGHFRTRKVRWCDARLWIDNEVGACFWHVVSTPKTGKYAPRVRAHEKSGETLLLTVGVFSLQLSFFAYSPLRCFLDILSRCKQRSSTVSKSTRTVSAKAEAVSKKTPNTQLQAKKLSCKQEASNCKPKTLHPEKSLMWVPISSRTRSWTRCEHCSGKKKEHEE